MAIRRALVRSLAKINLDLRVLHKRPDGFHELRTVFQTISLGDSIEFQYVRSRGAEIRLDGNVDIPDNLIVRAARAVFDRTGASGQLRIRLKKRIPMGAGLGGGSSNAAATLLAVPPLIGKAIAMRDLSAMASALGSDVPFFLLGGTALGVGRGTELYPLPDLRSMAGLLVASRIHVSTAEAYRELQRPLTTGPTDVDTVNFQSFVWGMGKECPVGGWETQCVNDFQASVFRRHPRLLAIRKALTRAGASPALMTGSGSAVFGLFESRDQRDRAAQAIEASKREGEEVHSISLVTRRRYQALWRAALREHIDPTIWLPRSRHAS